MLNDPAVLKKLAGIREIPTLPEVMHNVMIVLASEDSAAGDLADVLSTDQALCSKILKVANSAFFAQSRRIFDISDAIVLLGFDSIAQLALATTVFSAFGPIRSSQRFDMNGFWEHSIATAIASKAIADTIGEPSDSKLLYTAGLLHDIGKLLLITRFPVQYVSVFEKAESGDLFLHEAEQHVLGFTHCDTGEWVCDRWNFPKRLIRLIGDHHSASCPGPCADPEACIVWLANIICNRLHMGNSGNTKGYGLDQSEYSGIGLKPGDMDKITDKLESSRSQIESILKAME
ncbi:MAG: HDOD domain-containing protein [Candidatus Abyssubacteria bacterium]|nr:HDOD domain-containing protein [Candidatus Abyssubacteria bacterium]